MVERALAYPARSRVGPGFGRAQREFCVVSPACGHYNFTPCPRLDEHLSSVCFHCPQCGSLQNTADRLVNCSSCSYQYVVSGSVYDLVPVATDRAHERAYYDAVYDASGTEVRTSIAECAILWDRRDQPELAVVRQMLGNLTGKDVLLLGNGASAKELAFLLDRPRTFVYSDLSPRASLQIQRYYDLDQHSDRVLFAAVDAQSIPFAAETFDVVYGFAFVHHLPEVDEFIRQVYRVLRPGGRAVFMDDAYAPLWHKAKQSLLKPLMNYSHKATGISPEDYRFSMSGGFREEQLAEKITAIGAEPWFQRVSFLTYLVFRAAEKLLPRTVSDRLKASSLSGLTTAGDRVLCRLNGFRANQIRLIWGFSRPRSA
jgi:SAM-dependent methyltransferase